MFLQGYYTVSECGYYGNLTPIALEMFMKLVFVILKVLSISVSYLAKFS